MGLKNLIIFLREKFFVNEDYWLSLEPAEAELQRKAHLTRFVVFLTGSVVSIDNFANFWAFFIKVANYDSTFNYSAELSFNFAEFCLVPLCFLISLSNFVTPKNYHTITVALALFGMFLIAYAYIGSDYYPSLFFYYIFLCSLASILLDFRSLILITAAATVLLVLLRIPYILAGQSLVQSGVVYSFLSVIIMVIIVRVPTFNQVSLLLAKNKQLENLNKELELARQRVLEAVELERIRLAAELHDDGLAKINQLLGLITNKEIKSISGQELIKIQNLCTLIEQSVRTTTSNLHAPELEMFPLYLAIPIFAQQECDKYKLKLSHNIDDFLAGQFFARRVETTLYRLVQQSLDNIVKHSGASSVNIELRWNKSENLFFLEIFDDGMGFAVPENMKNLKQNKHFGLAGMLERVNYLSGKFEVVSTPGRGTKIKALIPALPRLEE